MDRLTADELNRINRQFYLDFGNSFSHTRHKAQPGVQKLSARVPINAKVLDIGCGNGTFAKQLADSGFKGTYVGLDFSPPLLTDAKSLHLPFETIFYEFDFYKSDLSHLTDQSFDLIAMFAVLHHLPGKQARSNIFRFIQRHLDPKGNLFFSSWQFLNSPKLKSRTLPWSVVGIETKLVDQNDFLLDWKSGGSGIRYAHFFTQTELDRIAKEEGFSVVTSFLSDGRSDNLGLYNIWQVSKD